MTVRTALVFRFEPWSTCCDSWPASFSGGTQHLICSCQNVISCRCGVLCGSNRMGLPRFGSWHHELAHSFVFLLRWTRFLLVCSSGPLSHAVSQCGRYTAAGLLSQPPAAAPAPGSQSRKGAASLQCSLCCFSRDMLLCMKLLCTLGLKLQANPFHPLRTLPGDLGLEQDREDIKGIEWGHWLQRLCAQQDTAESRYPRYRWVPPWHRWYACGIPITQHVGSLLHSVKRS